MSRQSGDSGGVDLEGPVWLKDGKGRIQLFFFLHIPLKIKSIRAP